MAPDRRLAFVLWLVVVLTRPAHAQEAGKPTATLRPTAEVRAAFLKTLDRPRVPLDVKESADEPGADGQIVERLSFASEKKADGRIERVPTLLVRPALAEKRRRPAVILLHGTGGSKEGMREWLDRLAARGFVALAIDARYHGERLATRAKGADAYVEAITKAWRTPDGQTMEHPFYYDTCWDLWRTVDYLETRDDVDPKRIAMLGISMGGIETWLAASADERVAVAIPAISVQSFRWGLENDAWQGRAKTIKGAHDAAARDLSEPGVNAKVCRTLWSKLIPGILDEFDGPSMIRLFSPRPLLVLNGELDPNCPVPGVRIAVASACDAYEKAGAADRFQVDIAEGVGHAVTDSQQKMAVAWLERWLKP